MGRREPIPVAPYDLFGQIPVTWPEIDAWCIAVAGLGPESWRRKYYVEYWNVVGKIQQAKLAGTLERILEGEKQK